MTQSNTPLWRELNEARTQGEWKQGTNTASKEWMQLFHGRTVVLEIHTINKKGQRQAGDFEKEDANAKYTALAVNNLASLAEALGAAIKREEKYRAILTGDRTYFTPPYTNKNVHIVELDEGLSISKTAIAAIS